LPSLGSPRLTPQVFRSVWKGACSLALTTYALCFPALLSHFGSFFITLADGVHRPRRPVHSTGLIERALFSRQCQSPWLAHLLLESLMQSLRWTTPTMPPSGRLRRPCHPDDLCLGGPAQQGVHNDDRRAGGHVVEGGEPPAEPVDTDCPGVLFEDLPAQVRSANCHGNYDRKAGAAAADYTGNIRPIGTRLRIHCSGLWWITTAKSTYLS